MESPVAIAELPSQRFQPRIYGVGAWTEHLHFAYDLVAKERPALLVELGTDRGESYFAFCQSVAENQIGTRCFAVDTWKGDVQSGFYEEITFQQVEAHNREHYKDFSILLRRRFDNALKEFDDGKIDILHLDGLHSEEVVRHDLDRWLPKLSPGGILLLHDVTVHNRDFGVWRAWEKLEKRGRSFAFEEGAGLGVWEKRPRRDSIFRNSLLDPTSETRNALVEYYKGRGRELKDRIANEWRTGAIRQSPFAQETVVQIFHTKDGIHREEDSVDARIGHDAWKDISISLSPGIGTAPLRIDFVSALTVIDLARLRVTRSGQDYFRANNPDEFDQIDIRGDAQRLPHPNFLRLKIMGIDPQLYLPPITPVAGTGKTIVEIRLRVHAAAPPGDYNR